MISINSSQSETTLLIEKCRYCWLNQSELSNDTKLIKCCLCTNLICVTCLKKRIDTSKRNCCEICLAKYILPNDIHIDMHVSTTKNSDTSWTLPDCFICSIVISAIVMISCMFLVIIILMILLFCGVFD